MLYKILANKIKEISSSLYDILYNNNSYKIFIYIKYLKNINF